MKRLSFPFLSVAGSALLGCCVGGCSFTQTEKPQASPRLEIAEGSCGESACLAIEVETIQLPALDAKVSRNIFQHVNSLLLRKTSGRDIASSPDEFVSVVRTDYRDAKEASGLEEAWRISRVAKILFQNQAVMTVSIARSESTGGIHPVDTVNFLSFDLKAGKLLEMRDILQPGKEALLQKLMTFELRRQREVPLGQPLRDAGFSIDDESPALIDMASLAIVGDAVKIHYNPYQIAPYALGPTELSLSPQNSVAVFRHESPYLAHLFTERSVQ